MTTTCFWWLFGIGGKSANGDLSDNCGFTVHKLIFAYRSASDTCESVIRSPLSTLSLGLLWVSGILLCPVDLGLHPNRSHNLIERQQSMCRWQHLQRVVFVEYRSALCSRDHTLETFYGSYANHYIFEYRPFPFVAAKQMTELRCSMLYESGTLLSVGQT